ncbi:nucleotidyltransferase domain-containing protein [uncultured Sphingomonas sp.]|uniref:nucleotidyltransferase domain-containing protein n=1 Tax=uncultured Sphingomonas sp. TaxID=158754 RepID=UPI0025DF5100|nr:nucleotidyltransferase domain-containing protein [uncultured Sphingomonas sp.]
MGQLLGVYVFGSVARGDRDPRSDLDLLAVVADGRGKVEESEVYSYVPPDLADLEASISWYGQRRLGAMFANGELFGWHLHQEAIPLFETEPVIAKLRVPAPYRDAAADVASFEKVLSGIPDQLQASPENAVYELGLVYVCLRNICMAASSVLCDRPDFSRYSPFQLRGISPVPITIEEYDLAMSCRMAGQRGLQPPSAVSKSLVANLHDRIRPWIAELRLRLERN